MTTGPALIDRLAGVYREARVLVFSEAGPDLDRALLLQAEFEALRTGAAALPQGTLSEWETGFLERTRRAVIVALRRQSLSLRQQWAEQEPLPGGESRGREALESTLSLMSAAMELHREGDRDAPETEQAASVIRRVLALATASFPEASVAPPAAAPAPLVPAAALASAASVTPPEPGLSAPASTAGPLRPAEPAHSSKASPGAASVAPAARRAPASRARVPGWAVVCVAAAAVMIGVGAFAVRPEQDATVGTRRVENVVSYRPAVDVPPPVPVPIDARTVALTLKTRPGRARVVVGGQERGTTPLRLEGRPGESLTVVLRRGRQVWRGVLRLGKEPEQVVTIALPAARPAATPRPSPTPPPRNNQARFEETMQGGVRLHEAGWFGPAVGRFRQAIAIDPASARAHLWLGRALYRAGRHAEAVQALEKVIELSQTGPHAEEARALLSRFR